MYCFSFDKILVKNIDKIIFAVVCCD